MNIHISCPKCAFSIIPDMKHAIDTGICPKCGEKMNVEDLPSAFMLIDIIKELKLPLSAGQITALLDAFLIKKLKMTFPEVVIVDEPVDKVRSGANNHKKEILGEDEINLPPLPPIGPDGKRPLPRSGTSKIGKDPDDYEGPGIDILDSEAAALKRDLDASKPIALPPNPKTFNTGGEGVVFYDKNSFPGRGPVLHPEQGHILPRPGDR